jgi:hypothetical protein
MRRTMIAVAATVLFGAATMTTDALAGHGGGGGHGGVHVAGHYTGGLYGRGYRGGRGAYGYVGGYGYGNCIVRVGPACF